MTTADEENVISFRPHLQALWSARWGIGLGLAAVGVLYAIGAVAMAVHGVTRGSGFDPVDLIIGRHPWQAAMLTRAREARIEETATARAAGFDEHLVKPVQGAELLQLLDEMRKAGAAPQRARESS